MDLSLKIGKYVYWTVPQKTHLFFMKEQSFNFNKIDIIRNGQFLRLNSKECFVK